MSQISDIQSYSLEDILKILHSEAQKMPLSPTSLRYIRALESLTATSCISRKEHRGDGDAEEKEAQAPLPPQRPQREIPESADQESLACPPPLHPLREALGDWVVNMWLMGVPFTTASLNLDIISAIYGAAVKAGRLPAISLFSELKAQLKALGSEGWNSGINEEIFTRALRLTKNANRLLLDDSVAADLVILSLTHGLLPLEQLALLRRNSDPESHAKAAEEQRPQKEMNTVLFASLREMQEDQVLQQIIARHCPNARKKYVFPLNQSQRTATAIRKQVFNMTNALFRRARLPQSTDPNQTVEALWAYAALRIGIPASQVVTHLGHAPLGLPVLKLCKSSVLSLKSSVLSLKS